MRLIDADDLKNLPFERLIHTDYGDTCVPIEEIDNAPTVDVDELIAELTDQIIDLTEFMDSRNIFVWIDENGKIHECRSKEEREAEYKVAWLKYITEEVKTNENND